MPQTSWHRHALRNPSWETLEHEQDRLIERVRRDPSSRHLLCSEPQSTFTTGKSGKPDDLIWSADECETHRVARAQVSRGGKWTYHGPGQLLLYPIVHLPELGLRTRDVVTFTDRLRNGTVRFLARYGVNVQAPNSARPFGIYVDDKKLVSFGLCLRNGICSHGLAMYLTPQSKFFDGIAACGVIGQRVTSMSELGVVLPWEIASQQLADEVEKGFKNDKS